MTFLCKGLTREEELGPCERNLQVMVRFVMSTREVCVPYW
jgi:hypothetical protein